MWLTLEPSSQLEIFAPRTRAQIIRSVNQILTPTLTHARATSRALMTSQLPLMTSLKVLCARVTAGHTLQRVK